MRLFLQVISLAAVVVLGWNVPFRDTAANALPWAQIEPSRLALIKERASRAPKPDDGSQPQVPQRPAATPRPPLESTSPLTKPPQRVIR
jgi:hypothetical protein